MRISVAICTRNRCDLLRQTLEHMTRLRIPEQVDWEVLVVDNASTDATPEVVASFVSRLPVRCLHEPQPGKSHALNLATTEATGDYILWTDDDVLVDAEWLAAYQELFRRRPAAGVFGGLIKPWFVEAPPEWLRRAFDVVSHAYAALDHGPEELPLELGRTPYGANMAVRTDVQRKYLYDTTLGPGAQKGLRGEETEMTLRMLKDGVEGWWVPAAMVRHYIPPERQSLAYLREYYEGLGKYKALMGEGAADPRLFGKPRWLWRSAFQNELQYRFGRLFSPPERWILHFRTASIAWGYLAA